MFGTPDMYAWSLSPRSGQLTIEEKIEMDVHYVDNCNLWLDLQIIVRTLVNMFVRRGRVYEQRYSRDREHESDT